MIPSKIDLRSKMKFAQHYKYIKKSETNLINHDEKSSIRLNKYLSESGVLSRREGDRAIEVGRVKINGVTATLGSKVLPGDIVTLDQKVIEPVQQKVYIALHKPTGIVSTTDTAITDNMITFMNYPEQIFPIGRLDRNSSGLILLTNDGDIVNKILRAEYGHDKEYIVTVEPAIKDDFLQKMSQGVEIYNPVTHQTQKTLPSKIKKVDSHTFNIVLNQGLNRQIRRMCDSLGYVVKTLKRVRIMHINLDHLPEGYWRYLTKDELIKLNEAIQS